MSSLHVLVRLGNGDDEVDVEVVDHVRDEAQEHDQARILEVRHLDIHRSEFNPPPNFRRLSWRRLESERIPVR